MNFIPKEEEVYETYEENWTKTLLWGAGGVFLLVALIAYVYSGKTSETGEKRVFVYSGSVQQQYDNVTRYASGVVTGFEQSRKDCNALAANVSKLKDKGLTVTSEAFEREFVICDSVAYASNKLSQTGADLSQK